MPETIEDNNSPSRRNSGDAYQQKHGTAEHCGLPITMQNLRPDPEYGTERKSYKVISTPGNMLGGQNYFTENL